jgi:predicted Zn-dependent protease
VEYALKCGYDPREMAKVFELFKSLKGGDRPPEWLSTHPDDDNRIAAIDAEVRTRYPQVLTATNLVRSTPTFNALSGRLRAAQQTYDVYDRLNEEFAAAVQAGDASRFPAILSGLRDCESRLPGHALFVSGQGVVLHQWGRSREARPYFERASAMQPDLFEPHAFLARIAFAEGDEETAFRRAQWAEELFPHHPIGHYIAGRVLDSRGQGSAAAEKYAAVMELAPEESEEYLWSARRLTEMGFLAAPAASGT